MRIRYQLPGIFFVAWLVFVFVIYRDWPWWAYVVPAFVVPAVWVFLDDDPLSMANMKVKRLEREKVKEEELEKARNEYIKEAGNLAQSMERLADAVEAKSERDSSKRP